jgi:serine/threonine protein kinase
MSPEIRSNRRTFDGHAVDVWALGPILFLMVAGYPPFDIASNTDERFYYFSRGLLQQTVHNWDLGLSANLLDLLQRMMWLEPRDRLSLQQIRDHPWMQGDTLEPPQRG